MEIEPGISEEAPVRSKYRGLSWDKKYQGLQHLETDRACWWLLRSCTASSVVGRGPLVPRILPLQIVVVQAGGLGKFSLDSAGVRPLVGLQLRVTVLLLSSVAVSAPIFA